MKKKFAAYLFVFMIAIPSTFSLAEPLDLTEAIGKALESNYSIRVVRQSERIAETNNAWGAAGRYPTIGFGLSSNNRFDFNEGPDQTSNSLTPSVTLNWILFNSFAVRITKEKLDALEKLSQGGTAVLVEQTVQSVVRAYYRALFEQEKLKLFEEIMNLSYDRFEYEKTRKEIGISVTFDVLQAKNAWLEDKAAHMQQEVTYTNALRDLKYLMGDSGDSTVELSDEFSAVLNDYAIDNLRDRMLSNNKTLSNQYLSQMLLEKETALARSLYYPTLSLRSGVDAFNSRTKYEDAEAATRNWQDVYGNISLNFNLFDGGARKRGMRIARIKYETGRIETDEMIHSLTNELSKLFDLYNVRKDLFNVTEENIEAAKLNLEISGDRFRAGTINSFNYRDVQFVYLSAALGRLQAIYNLIDTDTSLARITGGIVTEYGQ